MLPSPCFQMKLQFGVTLKHGREFMQACLIYKVLLIMNVQRHDPFPQIKHGGN